MSRKTVGWCFGAAAVGEGLAPPAKCDREGWADDIRPLVPKGLNASAITQKNFKVKTICLFRLC